VNVVHISGDNYDQMRTSLIKQAASLKSRVDSKDIQLDLDFEGIMKKLYAKEVEAAQAGTPANTTTSPSLNNVTSASGPQN
jgi:hypothetical protein